MGKTGAVLERSCVFGATEVKGKKNAVKRDIGGRSRKVVVA